MSIELCIICRTNEWNTFDSINLHRHRMRLFMRLLVRESSCSMLNQMSQSTDGCSIRHVCVCLWNFNIILHKFKWWQLPNGIPCCVWFSISASVTFQHSKCVQFKWIMRNVFLTIIIIIILVIFPKTVNLRSNNLFAIQIPWADKLLLLFIAFHLNFDHFNNESVCSMPMKWYP